jgi:hypothetical protein
MFHAVSVIASEAKQSSGTGLDRFVLLAPLAVLAMTKAR